MTTPVLGRQRRHFDHLGAAVDPPGLPSARVNVGPSPSAVRRRSRPRRGSPASARDLCLVLWRERVDRRLDHRDPVAVEPLPREARAREHVGIGARARSGAGSPTLRGRSGWDGRARRGSARSPSRRSSRTCGIRPAVCGSWRMTTSSGPHELDELSGVGGQRAARRCRVLGGSERPPSPSKPCRWLWSRLVISKNSGVAADHHPARVDAGPARVAEQRVAAARRRRRPWRSS